jgi:predicted dehydrogenase
MSGLSVGVVGCGYRATESHLPIYRETELPVTVDCVCDLDRELATRVARQFDVPTVYDDVSEMLGDADLDVVSVCVPPQAHFPVALEALRNGCHVFVEKPLTLSVETCDELIRAARERDLKIGVMHNMLYNEPFRAAKRRISAGEIGEVTGVRTLLTNPRDGRLSERDHWYHDLPGGLLTETLPHVSYIALDLMGSVDDVAVTAQQATTFEWAPHDEFEILFEGPDVMCSTRVSYSGTLRTMRVDILGTDGHLQVDMMANALYRFDLTSMDFLSLGVYSLSQIGQRVRHLLGNVAAVVAGDATAGSRVVIDGFLESVLRDRAPPVDGEDGRRSVAVLEETIQRYETNYGG